MKIGTKVRIERDETLYPSKGTWPKYRGKRGTVVENNIGEIGVVFGETWRDSRNRIRHDEGITWFQPYEISTPVRVPSGNGDGRKSPPRVRAPESGPQAVREPHSHGH